LVAMLCLFSCHTLCLCLESFSPLDSAKSSFLFLPGNCFPAGAFSPPQSLLGGILRFGHPPFAFVCYAIQGQNSFWLSDGSDSPLLVPPRRLNSRTNRGRTLYTPPLWSSHLPLFCRGCGWFVFVIGRWAPYKKFRSPRNPFFGEIPLLVDVFLKFLFCFFFGGHYLSFFDFTLLGLVCGHF